VNKVCVSSSNVLTESGFRLQETEPLDFLQFSISTRSHHEWSHGAPGFPWRHGRRAFAMDHGLESQFPQVVLEVELRGKPREVWLCGHG